MCTGARKEISSESRTRPAQREGRRAFPYSIKRYKTVPLLYLPCDIELIECNQKRETDSRSQGGNIYGNNFKGYRP